MCGCVALALGEGGRRVGVYECGLSDWLCVQGREREGANERAASQTNVVDDIDAAKPASAGSHTENSLTLFAS